MTRNELLQPLRATDPSTPLSKRFEALLYAEESSRSEALATLQLLFDLANAGGSWSHTICTRVRFTTDFSAESLLEYEVAWSAAEPLNFFDDAGTAVQRGQFRPSEPWMPALQRFFTNNEASFKKGLRGILPATKARRALERFPSKLAATLDLDPMAPLARGIVERREDTLTGSYCCGLDGLALAFPDTSLLVYQGLFC